MKSDSNNAREGVRGSGDILRLMDVFCSECKICVWVKTKRVDQMLITRIFLTFYANTLNAVAVYVQLAQ